MEYIFLDLLRLFNQSQDKFKTKESEFVHDRNNHVQAAQMLAAGLTAYIQISLTN